MVKVMIDVPKEIHRRVKLMASLEGVTITEAIVSMLGGEVFIDDDASFSDMLKDMTDGFVKEAEEEGAVLEIEG